jgi:hypothetical protein
VQQSTARLTQVLIPVAHNAAAGAGAAGAAAGITAAAVRITREAGVEYDDICASGLSGQPFPVPLDLFDLPHLSSILNLDTWQNVLEERDRQHLRALLPPGGLGEGPGEALEQLLQGDANLHFGNPVQRMWQGLQAGEFWGAKGGVNSIQNTPTCCGYL